MEVKVFGPGCAKCNQTADMIKEIATAKGSDITISKVSDIKEMMLAGIMATPAVAVDGVVKCTGRIPTKDEVTAWIEHF